MVKHTLVQSPGPSFDVTHPLAQLLFYNKNKQTKT